MLPLTPLAHGEPRPFLRTLADSSSSLLGPADSESAPALVCAHAHAPEPGPAPSCESVLSTAVLPSLSLPSFPLFPSLPSFPMSPPP